MHSKWSINGRLISGRCQDGAGVSKLHSTSTVYSKVQRTREPQQWGGHGAHIPVEVPVSAAIGVSGSSGIGRSDWILCLSVPKPHTNSWNRSASHAGWSLHLSHSVLLPGGDGPAAQGVDATRQGGRLSRLVAVPGPHFFTSPHDGCRPASVGGAQP